ncbi:hypothetical protein LR48_Vigan01g099800 [Vigna angularis]|uniref:Uncharacterized protein n=1 Tax=Phaseolus angularis TaxID=3914 RepID=A0A0L9TLK1_PHAAN|nr:hypothetical protein LR48_Vigan01g099800 [Vigna angularis]
MADRRNRELEMNALLEHMMQRKKQNEQGTLGFGVEEGKCRINPRFKCLFSKGYRSGGVGGLIEEVVQLNGGNECLIGRKVLNLYRGSSNREKARVARGLTQAYEDVADWWNGVRWLNENLTWKMKDNGGEWKVAGIPWILRP